MSAMYTVSERKVKNIIFVHSIVPAIYTISPDFSVDPQNAPLKKDRKHAQ